MKATDWTGHNWRERVFCCIALLNMEGFLTPLEHARVVKRAETSFNNKVVPSVTPDVIASTFHRSDDNVRWPLDDGKPGPFMFKRQAD